MAAGSGLTHASRKPEDPLKFSVRAVTKKIPDPSVSPRHVFLFSLREEQDGLDHRMSTVAAASFRQRTSFIWA
jgi:hypothetical protein